MLAFLNPYHDLSFGAFIIQFFIRFWMLITGQLRLDQLVSDEIQIAVLICVAASSALVGTFLVLRKMTMLANSLSHTILIGIVLAYLFTSHSDATGSHDEFVPLTAMLIASLAMGFVTTFLTEFLTKTGGLQEDASTGLVFTSLFALGVILVTLLTRNAHIGLEAVMGNADALHIDDLQMIFWILIANSTIFVLFFKEFKMTTFDPGLSLALGFSTVFFNYLLMAQVSATVIGSFRAVGVLLVLSFITGPVLTARLLTDSLKVMLIYAVGIGTFVSLVGVALTRHLLTVYGMTLSTSGVVVCVIVALYTSLLVVQWLGHRYNNKREWGKTSRDASL